MKPLRYALLICAMFVMREPLQAQLLFSQDFSSSSLLSNYVNSGSPGSGQWNAIGSGGTGVTVAISGGALTFTRTTASTGSFSRTTDFSPTPGALIYKFDLAVSGNTAAQTTAAVFQIGSGFGTANAAEINANVYARIGVNFSATNGNFTLRDLGAAVNSPTFSGRQTIFLALNNSGSTKHYVGPDSASHSLGNDTINVWAGTSIVFSAMNPTTATQSLTDLKFAFTAGTGTIAIDNISVTAIPEPSTYAVMLGLVALFGVMLRRRRLQRIT
jgi:hypothetical protein